MSRFGAVLVFCLAACLSLAQDLTQPVDYTTRAKPLRLVLADLSKKTDVRLTCAQNIEEEPLILKLSAVPLKEAMDKIAGVFGGTWSKSDKGFELAPGAQAEQWHKQALQSAADAMVKDVDDQLKAIGDKPWNMERATAYAKALLSGEGGNEPETTVQNLFAGEVLKIFRKIDPKSIVSLGLGERADYATDPTEFQRDLPQCDAEIAEVVTDENLCADALAANVPESTVHDNLLRPYPRLSPPFGKVVLDVESAPTWRDLTLDFYDLQGNRIKSFVARVGLIFDFKSHRQAEQEVRKQLQTGASLGPAAEEIAPYELTQDRSGLRPISDEARGLLLSPTQTDPLALATSDLALGLGDQMHLNVVYLPTDWGEIWAYIASRGTKANLPLLQKVMGRTNDTQLVSDDKWLTGRPTDPIAARQARIPRGALESFLRSVSQSGCLDIDSVASFALAIGQSPDVTPITFMFPPLGIQGSMPIYDIDGRASYAFFSSLSEEQKRTAKEGVLRFDKTGWSAEQLGFLETWILGSRDHLNPGGVQYLAPSSIKNPLPDVQRLNTEALHDGLSSGAYVEVTDRTEPRFHVKRSDVPEFDDPITIESLADTVSYAEQAKAVASSPQYDLQAIGSSEYRTVHVRLLFANGYGDSFDLNEDRVSSKKQNLAALLVSLPEDLKRRYDAELLKMGRQNGSESLPPNQGQPGAPPR